jgi:hypothetical protein
VTGLELAGGLSVWGGAALAGVLILSAFLAGVLLAARGASRRRRMLVGALYAAVAAALTLALLEPRAVTSSTRETRPRVAVLVDRSASMCEQDLPGGTARYLLASRMFAEGSALREELEKRAQPFYMGFDSDARALNLKELSRPPEGRSTDMARSLRTALASPGVGPLAGVIIVSDGRVTRGPMLALRNAELARREVAVWVVGAGDPASSARPRLSIASLEVPESAVIGETVTVEATVRAEGLDGRTVRVRLMADGKEVGGSRLSVSGSPARLPVRFSFLTRKQGVRRLRVEASVALPGNVPVARSSRYLVVKGRPLRAFYAEGRLGWGYRAMAASLGSAPRSSVELWAGFASGGDAVQAPKLQLIDKLRGLDVLVLGDVPSGRMDSKQLASLARAVREDGLGLIFMVPPVSAAGYVGTPLEPLLPVKLKYREVGAKSRRISLPAGGKRGAVLRLDRKASEDHRLWKSLSATHADWKLGELRQGARVLLRAGGDPLLVSWSAGRGRVAVMAWPDHWRWARNGAAGAEAHRRFFARLALWTAGREESGGSRLALSMTRYRLSPGGEVTLLARLLKSPPDGTRVSLSAVISSAASDEKQQLRVAAVGRGVYRMTVRGGAPGQYRIKVRAATIVAGWAEGELFFSVEGEDIETEKAAPDFAALRALARRSGGAFLGPAEVGRLRSIIAEKLPAPSSRTRRARRSLWDRLAIMIAGLLAACCAWLLLRASATKPSEETDT